LIFTANNDTHVKCQSSSEIHLSVFLWFVSFLPFPAKLYNKKPPNHPMNFRQIIQF